MAGWLLFLVYVLTIPIAYGIVKYLSMDKQIKYEGAELWTPAILWPFYLLLIVGFAIIWIIVLPMIFAASFIDKFVENLYEKRHKK